MIRKNFFRIVSLIVFFLFVFSATGFTSNNIIEPFGEIEWEDNLLEVIKKVNSRNDIERTKLEAHIGYQDQMKDVSKIVNEKEIKENLAEVISNVKKEFFGGDEFYKYHDIKNDKITTAYKTGESTYSGSVEIIANSIHIKSIEFKLVATFKPSMGCFSKFPHKIVNIEINNEKYFFPYYLEKVVLQSVKSRIPQKKEDEIFDTLWKKYEDKVSEKNKNSLFLICKDKRERTSLRIERVSKYNIIYENHHMGRDLHQLYEEHEATVKERNTKKEHDAAGEL